MILLTASPDIQAFGLKRSGHHAVINWILGHYENTIHFNDCIINKDNEVYIFSKNQIKGNSGVCLFSFEDQPNVFECNNNIFSKIKTIAQKKILVLRDPFNCYASRLFLKENYKQTKTHSKYWNLWDSYYNLELWKMHAREFAGITNFLGNAIKINYNRWFTDVEYRKNLSLNFFGAFTDKNFRKMSNFGNGSSFDGIIENAEKLDVLSRWKHLDNDYLNVIKNDSELVELSNELFNF